MAGFDILYALQDEAHDRSVGLHSVPVALGGTGARWLARALHLTMLIGLAGLGVLVSLGPIYFSAVVAVAAMLATSHWLVRAGLDRINMAFFTLNSWLSVVVFAGTLLDLSSAVKGLSRAGPFRSRRRP